MRAPMFLLKGENRMKLKNIGNKIVSVGQTIILPGEVKEVTGYDDNAVLDSLVKRKSLAIVKEKTTSRGK